MKRAIWLFAAWLLFPTPGLSADSGGYSYTTLQIPGTSSLRASGINDAGDIVGTYSTPQGTGHGFVYSKGVLRPIDGIGSIPSGAEPMAINNAGKIVGDFPVSGQEIDGFVVDTNGVITTIKGPGNPPITVARGINSQGQVVGSFGSTFGPGPGEQGFVYSNGTLTVLDYPGASNTQPHGINDIGQIVGTYYDTNGFPHGFLYSNGAFSTLDIPGSTVTQINAINNAGQIAIYHPDSSFVYANGVFTPVVYPDPQTSFTEITGINNNGVLVGNYSIGNTPATDPFIATPNPEPHALIACAAIATMSLLARRRVMHCKRGGSNDIHRGARGGGGAAQS